ncbi:MAG TPA: hypothetical protein VFH43_11525, partial [Candidatus Kapabacteria bacterium]|nr:hypothetical protein [Candidatus Kapabacteria bacterium]
METNYAAPREVGQYSTRAFILAAIFLGVGAIGLFTGNAAAFFQSYLVGYFYALCFALGCLGLLMVQHLSGGGWGIAIRRMLEAGAKTIPFFAILFIPIILGAGHIYEWTHEEAVNNSHILHSKAGYLNMSFWLVRAVIYFVFWTSLAYGLSKISLRQDKIGDPNLSDRMMYISGPGLLFFILLCTFASVDWFMSTEPEWFSTIYGMLFIAQQAVSVIAFMIVVGVLLASRAPMNEVMQAKHLHDLGKFMLAFTMLWAYFSFSQYIIVWAGNLPEETTWYLKRARGFSEYMAWFIILCHFFLPFAILLSRDVKRRAGAIAKIAGFMIFMRFVDAIWFLAPGFSKINGATGDGIGA